MRKHTLAQRQEYRERINRVKPWLKSTGAKTPEGKAIVSMNSLKTDPILHKLMKDYNILMKQQRDLEDMISL